MLRTVRTAYTKVNIHCGEIKNVTYLSLSNTVTHDRPTAMSAQSVVVWRTWSGDATGPT